MIPEIRHHFDEIDKQTMKEVGQVGPIILVMAAAMGFMAGRSL